MNQQILSYKYRFTTIALLLGYAVMHVKLTGMSIKNPIEQMLNFTNSLPFAQRLLAPFLINVLKSILPLPIGQLFFLLEWAFISLFYFALRKLLVLEFSYRQAQALSWLFLLLLPLMTVVNYGFTNNGKATLFYSYDTLSLFFMAAGMLFCLRSQWFYLIFLIFVATFNRESSFLLVVIIPALHWQHLRRIRWPTLFALLAYFLARMLIFSFLHQAHGSLLEWYHLDHLTHFDVNLIWLMNQQHILFFVYCFAGLPLFWFAFYDYIPERYRPLRYVAFFYFLALLLVGNFMEARLFHELIVLIYMPVVVAINRWLMQERLIEPAVMGLLYYVNRYAILGLLVILIILRQPLSRGIIWFVS